MCIFFQIGNLEDVYLFQVNGHETEPRLTRGRARDGDTVIRSSPQPARQDQLQAEESVNYHYLYIQHKY